MQLDIQPYSGVNVYSLTIGTKQEALTNVYFHVHIQQKKEIYQIIKGWSPYKNNTYKDKICLCFTNGHQHRASMLSDILHRTTSVALILPRKCKCHTGKYLWIGNGIQNQNDLILQEIHTCALLNKENKQNLDFCSYRLWFHIQ